MLCHTTRTRNLSSLMSGMRVECIMGIEGRKG